MRRSTSLDRRFSRAEWAVTAQRRNRGIWHVAERRGGLRQRQDRAAINDNTLPVNGDHPGGAVDAVERKAEGLALAQASASSQQDEQRVPLRHGVGKREDLGRGEQPHSGLADFRKPDVDAGVLRM